MRVIGVVVAQSAHWIRTPGDCLVVALQTVTVQAPLVFAPVERHHLLSPVMAKAAGVRRGAEAGADQGGLRCCSGFTAAAGTEGTKPTSPRA